MPDRFERLFYMNENELKSVKHAAVALLRFSSQHFDLESQNKKAHLQHSKIDFFVLLFSFSK